MKANCPLPATIVGSLLLACSGFVCGQATEWDHSMSDGQTAMAAKQYAQAETSYRQALAFSEKHFKNDARSSATLVKLAESCNAQGKKDDAETFANRAATSLADALKAHKPKNASEELQQAESSAALFDRVGDIFSANEKYADAEGMYQRVIAVRVHYADQKPPAKPTNEDFLRLLAQGATNSQAKVADAEDKLGNLYVRERKFSEAEELFRQSAAIREKVYGADQPPFAQSLGELARCYALQGEYARAELLYKQVVEILEHTSFRDTAEMAACLENYALVLRKTGQEAQAKSVNDRAQALRVQLSKTAH